MNTLSTLPKQDGFKFIGIDKDGNEHFCMLRKKRGQWVMTSNTAHYDDLEFWKERE